MFGMLLRFALDALSLVGLIGVLHSLSSSNKFLVKALFNQADYLAWRDLNPDAPFEDWIASIK